MMQTYLLKVIRGYQKFISPLIPARCRYYPTCSNYGIQAIQWHGATKGGWLTVKRICRCHPLAGHGIDFVPLPLYLWTFNYIENTGATKSRTDFVYIDHQSYRHQLNQWL